MTKIEMKEKNEHQEMLKTKDSDITMTKRKQMNKAAHLP